MTSPDLSAFVLAGGKSSRMGTDKAFLKIGPNTLLEHALGLARSAAEEVRIVGKRETFDQYATAVEDIFADCGPLGGIHAGIKSSKTELNLVLSVDTPFISREFLSYLISQVTTDAVVTVPRVDGRWQPLCAVYRRSFADIAERALRSGRYKIDALFGQVAVRALDETEWQRLGFSPLMFWNLNTPEEYKAALEGNNLFLGEL
jgi:molybdopterin-guanine dinucleotide biosynthesis protein A